MTNENARLSKEITELKQQKALLLQSQHNQPLKQENAPKIQRHAPTMHPATTNDKNILTPEFIALEAQAIQKTPTCIHILLFLG